MSDPLPLFSAVLLYDTPQEAPLRRHLVAQLNALLGDADVTLEAVETGADACAEGRLDGRMALACEAADLEITFSSQPQPMEGFLAAIRSPHTRLTKVDHAGRVAAHRGSITLSVTGPGDATRPDDPVLAVVLLHRAIGVILDLVDDEPEVVHWRQSDTLHTADAFRRTLARPFPAVLVSHPRYFTGPPGPNGRPSVGFEAVGSEVFCESRLVVEPSTRNPGSLKALVDYLVEAYATGEIDLDDGAALPAGAAGTVRLAHAPGSAGAPGRILIRLEQDPGGTASASGTTSEAATEAKTEAKTEDGTEAAPGRGPTSDLAPRHVKSERVAPQSPAMATADVPRPSPIAAPPATFDRRPPSRSTLQERQAPAPDWAATDSAIALMLSTEPAPQVAAPPADPSEAADVSPASRPRIPAHRAFSDPDNYSSQNIDAIGARSASAPPVLVPDADPAAAAAPQPRPARRWLRAIWPRNLREFYTPDPEQSTVRHLAIAGLLFLVIPVLGFVLFVATLFRGPLPKLTALAVAIGLGSLAIQVIAGQAFAF